MKHLRLLFTALVAPLYFVAAWITLTLLAASFAFYQAASRTLALAPLSLGVNALGTLDAAQLVLQRAFQLTFTRFPALRMIAKGMKELDGRVETMSLGQTAIAHKLSLSGAGNFGDNPSAFSMSDIPVTLSNFPQISHQFSVDELNRAQQGFNLLDMAAFPMAVKLAQSIVARIAALVATGNFNTTVNGIAPYLTVTAAAATRANLILPLQTACNERGIPENLAVPTIAGDAGMGPDSNRFVVLNSTANAALLADALIVAELNNAANSFAIKTGKLPEVSGFDFFAYPQMPNTDGNLVGFAGSADALAYVARAPRTPWDLIPDLPKIALQRVVQDPITGFQVLLIIDGQIGSMAVRIRLIWLDGLAVGNNNNLVRLVSGVAAGTAGTVVGLTVTNPGYGYVNTTTGAYTAPTVTITPAAGDVTGSGATATATISTNGAVTALAITAAGTLYTLPPVVTFTPAAGCIQQGPASAVATVGGLS